jgi:hypothetical protein
MMNQAAVNLCRGLRKLAVIVATNPTMDGDQKTDVIAKA